jgi:glycerophosphoryl diester phosphodiesterase
MKKKPFVVLCTFWIIQSCNAQSKMKEEVTTTPINNTTLDVQGHRGCRGLMPENTIPAMIKALELGVTTLELDVVITKDKQVVLSHEPFFNHEIASKPNGELVTKAEEKSLNIFQMTMEEISRYDVGMRIHTRFPEQTKLIVAKPSLDAVFDSVKAYCDKTGKPIPFFNIETKSNPKSDNIYHPAPAVFVDILMAVIIKKGMQEKSMIQSFDFRTLQYLHQQYPGMATVALVEDFDKIPFEAQLNKLGFTPTVYSPSFSLVDSNLVAACQQKKVRLIPWTVNDTADMKRMKNLGVDGIITDYPDRLLKLR